MCVLFTDPALHSGQQMVWTMCQLSTRVSEIWCSTFSVLVWALYCLVCSTQVLACCSPHAGQCVVQDRCECV